MRQVIFGAKSWTFMRRDRQALAQMVRAERLSVEALGRLSDERSTAAALYAFRTTEFYREHFTAAGFTERDIAQSQNFTNLPVLTKSHIQDAGTALASSSAADKDRLVSRTGGSTGRPLQVYNDRRAPTAALWWRVYGWWGVSPADNVAFIYRQSRTGVKKFRYDVEWWPTRHVLLDARGTTRQSIEEFQRALARTRPQLLVGYVEGVREFAEYVLENDVQLPPLRAVSVTASMLHPGQRELIERALGAKVYDTYRSAEVPWIAAECESQVGLHVLADRRRVDVVNGQGGVADAGSSGDVAVTDFENRAYPLIRYAIGDRTRWLDGQCPCGRTLPRVAPLEGRVADVLRTPSGRIVSGGSSALFNAWPGAVRQFQLHQKADYAVTVRYVPGADHQGAHMAAEEVRRTVSTFLNQEVVVSCVAVDAIEAVAGKTRLVVSEAPAPVKTTTET